MQKNNMMKIFTAAAMLAAVILLCASCSGKSDYDKLDGAGYTVSVKFDPGDAQINSTSSIVTDVFNPDDYTPDSNGNISIPLLTPDDERRDKNNRLILSNPYHFLAGWYTERTPIDPADTSKGYTYSGRWDFEKDKLVIDADASYSSAECQLTLYAAWIPYFNYEIYAKNDATGRFELLSTEKAINLKIPSWKDGDVSIDMGNFPEREGYTLDCVYTDAACTSVASDTVTGKWNKDSGTQTESTVKIYTTWLEGEYYRIYSAEDLRKNASVNAHYEILADLDFSSTRWPAIFKTGKFGGTINGNGHTISNITAESTTGLKNGLFAEFTESASVKDVSFENIIHTINTGRINPDSYYGLLAGAIDTEAIFDNVSVTGKLLIGDNCQNLKSTDPTLYTICLLSGSGKTDGIVSSIVCEKKNPDNTRLTFEIAVDDNGYVTLIFAK